MKSTKKDVKIKSTVSNKQNQTSGRLVITADKYHKVIPAVIFSEKEAKALLEIVDELR